MSTLAQTRSVRLTAALLDALRSTVAESASDPVHQLRQAGFLAGSSFHSLLEEWTTASDRARAVDDLPVARFWLNFADFWEAQGWGRLEHREIHPGISVLESRDWLEAELPGAVPGCHVTTGILAEMLRLIAGQEIAVLEVSCRGRGDESCRFLIGSPATLETLYEEIRDGVPLEVAVANLA
jgi:predicted hydrocarbon binding protein